METRIDNTMLKIACEQLVIAAMCGISYPFQDRLEHIRSECDRAIEECAKVCQKCGQPDACRAVRIILVKASGIASKSLGAITDVARDNCRLVARMGIDAARQAAELR